MLNRVIGPFFVLAFMLSCLCSDQAFAQDQSNTSGRAHVYDFLNVVTNPRAAGLGNAFVAMKNDPNAFFSNPATLSTLTQGDTLPVERAIGFGFTKYILDINEGYISYDQTLADSNGSIGAGVQYIDYGTFQGYDTRGLATSDFGARELALSVGYSNVAPHNVHYGVAVKFISSSLVSGSSVANYSSTGIAADAGLYYEFKPALMTFGVSALNIGTQLKTYAGVQEALPFDLTVGFSKKLERLPLTVHLSFHNLTRDLEGHNFFFALNDFSFGGEFAIGKILRLRVGYENQKRQDLKLPTGSGLAGFSLGAGIVVKRYQFDYSFNSLGLAFQPLHRLGVGIAFY